MGKITEKTRRKWIQQIRYLEHETYLLSSWELEFMDSISKQFFSNGKDLSFKQSQKLREIVHRIEEKAG